MATRNHSRAGRGLLSAQAAIDLESIRQEDRDARQSVNRLHRKPALAAVICVTRYPISHGTFR